MSSVTEIWEWPDYRLHNFYDAHRNTEVSVDGDIYISLAITNEGPDTIKFSFFYDLYVDGVMIMRLRAVSGMSINRINVFRNWSGLKEYIIPEPGVHTLKLVVDPTDLVPETDESDNVYEQEVTWAPSESPLPEPTSTMTDLVPFTPSGWTNPIVVTSYSGETGEGPLSASVPTYIRVAFRNEGQDDISEKIYINVNLYLDGVLVDLWRWPGMPAGYYGTSDEWSGLYEVVNVTPGTHILKIVLDPTDLVLETNEDNNVFEKEFTWGTGPVPP